jgi:hypothetical protein
MKYVYFSDGRICIPFVFLDGRICIPFIWFDGRICIPFVLGVCIRVWFYGCFRGMGFF